jgi:hypothetical protein
MLQMTAKPADENDRVAGQGTLDQILADLNELYAMGASYVTLDTYSGNPADLHDLQPHFDDLAAVVSSWRSSE